MVVSMDSEAMRGLCPTPARAANRSTHPQLSSVIEQFFQYRTDVDAGLGATPRSAYAAGLNVDAPQQPEAGQQDDVAA